MFSPLWTISHSVHMLFVDTRVYFNSTNLDVFVLSASTTTDTDSILPCCLAFFTNVEPRAFWWIDRAHKNIAKCYNTGGSNFNHGFSIAFALDSSQVSFALNVCRNELKVDVMCWCGLGVDVEKTLHGVLGPSGSFERLQNPVGLLCRVFSRIAFIVPQHIEQQFWLTFFQICCIYFTHRCEKYVPYEQKKNEKKDDLECNPMTPLSMKFKGDESGFLLPGRFVKA